jgi:hypothetical protein
VGRARRSVAALLAGRPAKIRCLSPGRSILVPPFFSFIHSFFQITSSGATQFQSWRRREAFPMHLVGVVVFVVVAVDYSGVSSASGVHTGAAPAAAAAAAAATAAAAAATDPLGLGWAGVAGPTGMTSPVVW